MPLQFTNIKTASFPLTPTAQAVATLSTDGWVYYIKASNMGSIAQDMRLEQNHHTRTVRDRTVIPATDPSAGGNLQGTGIVKGETFVIGGRPGEHRLLTLDDTGTLTAAAVPDGSLSGGSIHVTVGIAET